MEYTVIENTVNLASRLEEMVDPGQVLVSENVYQKNEGEFPLNPIGKRILTVEERSGEIL